MLLTFFLLGAASVVLLLVLYRHYVHWRILKNPKADFAKPGVIPLGTFERFLEGLDALFPDAPARSNISISPGRRNFFDVPETQFIIRPAGKRDGRHSFQGELRLGTQGRYHAVDAIPMLKRIGDPLERIDKSPGQLVLKMAKLDDVSGLIDVAGAFANRDLLVSEGAPVQISWHIAGYHGSKPTS